MLERAIDPQRAAGGPSAPSVPANTDNSPLLTFTPVPRRYRRNGWTPDRQRDFIAALAETGCVAKAAARVGMARTRCYALRRADGACEFRLAWDAAIMVWAARARTAEVARRAGRRAPLAARRGFSV